MDIGGDQSKLLLNLMKASALRGRVLANNIANQNTPGFQRQVVRFEELLTDSMTSGRDPLEVQPSVEFDKLTPAGPDGNNVSLEVETAAARENRLLFELYAQIFQSRMGLIQSAIESSR